MKHINLLLAQRIFKGNAELVELVRELSGVYLALPAFGKKADKIWFLQRARKLVYRFAESDVSDYGGTELLLFARSVMLADSV